MCKKITGLTLFMLLFGLQCLNVSLSASQHTDSDSRLTSYLKVLDQEGQEPLAFVLQKLKERDLIIFDDSWHSIEEPFEFFREMIRTPIFHQQVKYIFVEVFSGNMQHHLDAYFNAPVEDRKLLYPVFQGDFSGKGWALKSYFDLLKTIYDVNKKLPRSQSLKVLAVNAPSFWPAIRTHKELKLFWKSHIGSDYIMYRTILAAMDNFKSGRKGIFLTNTRHAYKGIKDKQGQYFRNCGTFFYDWHPGKTYSIRFHNMALLVERQKKIKAGTVITSAGMERISYKWIRMGNGIWDDAFKAMGNKPVAISLKGNIFGTEPYVGNHVHNAAPGQTMYDAHDAIIFLAPLENLHNCAKVDFIYTPSFKKELARRLRIIYTKQQLEKRFAKYGVDNLQNYIEKRFVASPRRLIPQVKSLPPIDAWRKEKGVR